MTAPRIQKAPLQHRRKPNQGLRPKHLAFVRSLPCVACGGPPPCIAAHVRMSRADIGKANTMARKPDDKYTVPLHDQPCHGGDQHTKYGEPEFWARLGIDPVDLSLRLWSVTGNLEQGIRAVMRARQSIALHQKAGT
jgi:hypothetical protein